MRGRQTRCTYDLAMSTDPHFDYHRMAPRMRRRRALVDGPLRRLRVVSAALIAGALLGGGLSWLSPPRFVATALVRADWETPAASPVATDRSGRRLRALRQQLLARPAVERVLRESRPFAATGESGPAPEQATRLLLQVSVEPRSASSYAIGFAHRDASTAARVVNGLVDALAEESGGRQVARGSPADLEARLAAARATLDERQAALRRAREAGASATPAPSVGSTQEQTARRSLDLALSQARARADRLRTEIEMETPSASPATGAAAELEVLRARRAELRQRYTEEHPDVQALTRRIRRLEAEPPPDAAPTAIARLASLRVELAGVEREIETLQGREASLEAEAARAAGRAKRPSPSGAAAAAPRDVATLAREVDEAQAAFLELERQWQDAETAARLGGGVSGRFEVAQRAEVPARPAGPARAVFPIVGALLGLAVGWAFAVAAELRDPSVRDEDDLRSMFAEPVLAVLPEVDGGSRPR
jgi:uncharacterized protein involved in exopolysaccharide biosynthesis